jgi:protein SCO1/2
MRIQRAIGLRRATTAVRAALLILFAASASPASAATPQTTLPGNSIYNIASEWTTQDGRAVHLESLRGRPVVVAMIYLNCPDICPLIAENMQRIQADLPKKVSSKIGFALFSFDANRDSADKLKAYAAARGLDTRYWTLYRSSDMAARELAAALDVTFRKTEQGVFDHSVVISLLDADGVVAYRQVGLKNDTKEFVSSIMALEKGSPK